VIRVSQAECEGLAAYILERGGWGPQVNPWAVIDAFRVRVEYGEPGERPHCEWRDARWVIVVDPLERPQRQGLAALHELAHLLLDANGITNDEEHAWWLSTALLLPRDVMLRARRRGATIEDIVREHPDASHEAVARRIVAMASSLIVWVWDVAPSERKPYRVISPGWRWALRAPCELEWGAMREARSSGSPIEPVGGVRAWAVTDLPWIRIFCLSDAEVLLPSVTRGKHAIAF
jgi:hypothetical protein